MLILEYIAFIKDWASLIKSICYPIRTIIILLKNIFSFSLYILLFKE